MDELRDWADHDLSEALRRAWREAARSRDEARVHCNWREPVDEVGRMLTASADSAMEWYDLLLAETNRRREVRRQALVAAHGKCSHCREPNAPGETMCAGHIRLSSYDPGAEYAPNH